MDVPYYIVVNQVKLTHTLPSLISIRFLFYQMTLTQQTQLVQGMLEIAAEIMRGQMALTVTGSWTTTFTAFTDCTKTEDIV